MSYITELHCHTAEISACATVPTKEIAELYAKHGYATLTVMNHLSRFTFAPEKSKYHGSDDWNEKIDFFMSGYHLMKEAADGRFNVLWGIELRLNTDENDYLIYGVTEEFLRSHPDIMNLSVKALSELIHAEGLLLFQAHPFRNSIRVVKPTLIDGIETYNGHPGHDSRNNIAILWAEQFGLKQISGTDFHCVCSGTSFVEEEYVVFHCRRNSVLYVAGTDGILTVRMKVVSFPVAVNPLFVIY